MHDGLYGIYAENIERNPGGMDERSGQMKLLKYEDVVKAVDEHTNDDGQLDDDITCILEEVPAANIELEKWLSQKIDDAQREWDTYVVEEAIPERNAYMNVLHYLKMKGVIE